jgi:predicted nucleotide-binding protein (sugar kinase/HSP70/actin superfamily)
MDKYDKLLKEAEKEDSCSDPRCPFVLEREKLIQAVRELCEERETVLAQHYKSNSRSLQIEEELYQQIAELTRENERLRQNFQLAAEDYEKELVELRAKLERVKKNSDARIRLYINSAALIEQDFIKYRGRLSFGEFALEALAAIENKKR